MHANTKNKTKLFVFLSVHVRGCLSGARGDPQYRLCLETVIYLLQPVEKSMLQDRHATLWDIHCHGVGMRVRYGFLPAHMVFHAVFQAFGHQLWLHKENVDPVCQLLLGANLHSMWNVFPCL